jgi:hypothetical protein
MTYRFKSLTLLAAILMSVTGCGGSSTTPAGVAGAGAGAAGVLGSGAGASAAAGTVASAGTTAAAGTAASAGTAAAAGTGVVANVDAGVDAGGADVGCGLGLPVPAKGFQVCTTGVQIQAMQDTEYCEVVTLPGSPTDTYYVNRVESQMSPNSHHLIVLAADPGSSNEANMPDGKRVGCTGGEGAFGQGLSHVAGAQLPYSDQVFPAGVGKIFHGGQRLSFDYHYFNVTDAPILAKAALNMYQVEQADVEHIAHQLGFYNFNIVIPSGQASGFEMSCTAPADIMVYSLTRHTHHWGTDFTVWNQGGANAGAKLWTSTDYEGDTTYLLPGGPVLLKAGTGYKFRCDYDNTSDHLLTFGVKTTDEMCILFGTWWKVNETDNVGTGTMTCKFPQ